MKPDDDNITGVESFDHSSLKQLPEYHKAREALDDLVQAINRLVDEDEELVFGQVRWLKVVEQMANSLTYADASGHDRNRRCSHGYERTWPYRATVRNGWVHGSYRCPLCQEEWTCGYAVNIAVLAP